MQYPFCSFVLFPLQCSSFLPPLGCPCTQFGQTSWYYQVCFTRPFRNGFLKTKKCSLKAIRIYALKLHDLFLLYIIPKNYVIVKFAEKSDKFKKICKQLLETDTQFKTIALIKNILFIILILNKIHYHCPDNDTMVLFDFNFRTLVLFSLEKRWNSKYN